MRVAIDAIVTSNLELPDGTGLVVGLLKGAERFVFGYGSLDGEPAASGTIFEIGSVSKVFTTAMLAVLVADRTVTLEEQVRALAPELSNLPSHITLLRLATHTSGLPRMPSNLLRSTLRNPGNPHAAYKTEDMLHYLSRRKFPDVIIEEGKVYYSNLGMGLLGMILASRVGAPYEEAIASTIASRLGLKDTCIHLSPDQIRRLASPHNARGRVTQNWDAPGLAGAGALRSTAEDLLSFLAAHLEKPPSPLSEVLQTCHSMRTRNIAPPGGLQRLALRLSAGEAYRPPAQTGMGLGWNIGRLPTGKARMHWHHGGTGGYRAFVGFIKDRGAAAVVLANTGLTMMDALSRTTATDKIGFSILERLNSAG
jgi:CubicO group peptidase (beta-lactamase class C family)